MFCFSSQSFLSVDVGGYVCGNPYCNLNLMLCVYLCRTFNLKGRKNRKDDVGSVVRVSDR